MEDEGEPEFESAAPTPAAVRRLEFALTDAPGPGPVVDDTSSLMSSAERALKGCVSVRMNKRSSDDDSSNT